MKQTKHLFSVLLFFSISIFARQTEPDGIVNLTADNKFTAMDDSHGLIGVDGENQVAPYNFQVWHQDYITFSAITGQVDDENYIRSFKEWKLEGIDYPENWGNNLTITRGIVTQYNGGTVNAYWGRLCNVTFSNQLEGYGSHGTIIINSNSYPSGTTLYLNSLASHPLTYQSAYWINGVRYDIQGATTENKSFNEHTNYVKYYKGTPTWPSSRNLAAGPSSDFSARVKLMWNAHPNSNVKFRIFRKCNTPQHPNEDAQIAELSNTTTQFIDNDFYWYYGGASTIPTTVQYDVRLYYPASNTYAAADYITVQPYYRDFQKTGGENASEITTYSIANYPNPFNPTTKVEYQLPKAGHTTVKVYNTLGKEVITLVDEFKETGKYTAEFDGSNLPSGIYFYELRSNSFVQMKKMLLVK